MPIWIVEPRFESRLEVDEIDDATYRLWLDAGTKWDLYVAGEDVADSVALESRPHLAWIFFGGILPIVGGVVDASTGNWNEFHPSQIVLSDDTVGIRTRQDQVNVLQCPRGEAIRIELRVNDSIHLVDQPGNERLRTRSLSTLAVSPYQYGFVGIGGNMSIYSYWNDQGRNRDVGAKWYTKGGVTFEVGARLSRRTDMALRFLDMGLISGDPDQSRDWGLEYQARLYLTEAFTAHTIFNVSSANYFVGPKAHPFVGVGLGLSFHRLLVDAGWKVNIGSVETGESNGTTAVASYFRFGWILKFP